MVVRLVPCLSVYYLATPNAYIFLLWDSNYFHRVHAHILNRHGWRHPLLGDVP